MRASLFRRSCTRALFLLLVSSFAPAGAHAAGAPLRIDDHLPERLSLTFVSRARYEFLHNRFRVLTSGDADILVFRTLIHARVAAPDKLTFGAEMIDVQFWGLFYVDSLPGEHRGELFVFGLHENDTDRRPTRNRQLVTPGFRFWKPPTKGAPLSNGQGDATYVYAQATVRF